MNPKILILIEMLTEASRDLGHVTARKSELERKIAKLKRDLEKLQAAVDPELKREA